MNCKKCKNVLTGKQTSYCSPKCSKVHLKALYRIRNIEKVREYHRNFKKLSNKRPLPKQRRIKFIEYKNGMCEKCLTKNELQVHHIRPLRTIGTHEYSNLMCLCKPCHQEWEKRMIGYWY